MNYQNPKFLLCVLIVAILLSACTSPTPAGQVETQVAATVAARDAATAAVNNAVKATLTASVPLPTATLPPSPTFTAVPQTVTLAPTANLVLPTPILATLPPAKSNIFKVTVPGNIVWVGTHISLNAGQNVSISASGVINSWGGTPSYNNNPDMKGLGVCERVECAMQGANYGVLVGRIGFTPPFRVGALLEFSAPTAGELYLAFNDHRYDDNLGSYEVTITVR